MNKNMLMLAAAAAGAASILLAPTASADTDAVYIGGTGTGMHIPGVETGGGTAYVKTFVPEGVDHLTNLDYDGAPWANPQAAVPAALEAVKANNDPTVVIAVSKGAQVAHGLEAKDTRTDTNYIVVGDPDSKNGISRTLGLSPKPVVHTHDWDEVVAEYDGVGDMPDRPNLLAVANALAGWAFVHTQYGNGTAGDPLTHLDEATKTSTKNPNGTTYTKHLIPTKNLPLLKPLRDTELTLTHQSRVTDALNAALKPVVDKGYSRNDTKDGNKVSPTKVSAPKSGNDKGSQSTDAKTKPAEAGSESEDAA